MTAEKNENKQCANAARMTSMHVSINMKNSCEIILNQAKRRTIWQVLRLIVFSVYFRFCALLFLFRSTKTKQRACTLKSIFNH